MLMNMVLVAAGGGLGSLLRYLLSVGCTAWFGTGFSWGTLTANAIGCFLIGIAAGLLNRELIAPEFRLLFVTGFLGGLTTFSTFSLETINYFRDGLVFKAAMNVLVNTGSGLLLTLAGLALADKR